MYKQFILVLLVGYSVLVSISGLTAPRSLNGFDLSNRTVPLNHIVHGGPPKDGIPAILEPNYIAAKKADFMRPEDVILGFGIDNQFFAYPRYLMDWHELVNDQINDHAFTITYCPLCGSGMAFSSKVNGENLVFGVSGLVMNSDVLFYDKGTESLWSQLDQTAISGDYAGTKLESLYLEHTTWQRWLQEHPNTKVLSEEQGVRRNYRNGPYTGYDSSSSLYFKVLRTAPKRYHIKERVLGLQINGQSKAYPFLELRKHGESAFNDELAGVNYRVSWDAENETATIKDKDGKPMVTTQAFWFAWYAFHPETKVFKGGQFLPSGPTE